MSMLRYDELTITTEGPGDQDVALILPDGHSLKLGTTGADDQLSASGTATLWTHVTGNWTFDNTAATGFTLFDLGTDTTATGFRVRNNSGTVLLEVLGDGSTIFALDGTNDTIFTVNEDAVAGTEDGSTLRLKDGDGGTEIIFADLAVDASADLIYFRTGGGAAGATRKSTTLVIGAPGETTASMDSTIRFEGAANDTTNRTATIVHLGEQRSLTITASNSLVLSDGTGSRTSTAGAVTHAGVTTYELDTSGAITIESSGGAISIAADNIAQAANFATAGARVISVGSAAAASLALDAGVGAGSFQADTTMDVFGGGISTFGDDVARWSFDGAGAVSETGMTSLSATPSGAITLTAGAASTWSTSAGALNLTSAGSATWQLSGNDAGTLTLTIDAINAGVGEGHLALNADEQIDLNDGTATLTMDAGVWTETALVSLDITPSGTITFKSGGIGIYGDDTGWWQFDGAGALTSSGLVSASVTPSGAITLTAGADSVWQTSINGAGNVSLTIDSNNAGAGQGNLILTAKTTLQLSDAGNPAVSVPGSGAWTFTGNPTLNFGTGALTFGQTAFTSTAALAWTTKANDALSLSIGPAAAPTMIVVDSLTSADQVHMTATLGLDLNGPLDQDVARTAAGDAANVNMTINHATDSAQAGVFRAVQLTTARTGGTVDGVTSSTTSLAGDLNSVKYSAFRAVAPTDGGGTVVHQALTIEAGHDVAIDLSAAATGESDIVIGDDLANALEIREGANTYLKIDTENAGAEITLGNATTNPAITQVGSGQVTFTGNVNATGGLDVTGANLTVPGVLEVINDRFVQVVINAVGGAGGATAGTMDVDVQTLDGVNVARTKYIKIVATLTAGAGEEALVSTVTFGGATAGTIVTSGNGYCIGLTDASGNLTIVPSDSADETVYFSAVTVDGGVASAGQGCVVVESVRDDATWAA